MVRQRVDIQEAAQRLNVSTEALRKRILRGTMESEKDESGRVFVWVDSPDRESPSPDEDQTEGQTHPQQEQTLLVEVLREQLEAERRASSELRRLLAAALERIPPQLEPPEESPAQPRESPVSDDGAPYGTSSQEAEESLHRRSWWQRWFGTH